MCWTCNINKLKAQTAKEDINVYKVVKSANRKYCVSPFMELRDELRSGSIKKGYYTNSQGLFCKVCNIEGDNIHVYELDTTDLPSLTKETYYWRSFKETYYKNCTKEEYDKALDKIINYFKD